MSASRGETRDRVGVRAMRGRDVPAVARIERAAFGREAWPREAFAALTRLFAAARPARGRLWVAEDPRGRIVGYAGIELSALGGEADLVNLAVDAGARRRGAGSRLLAAALAECRRRRVDLFWLRVRASNRGARAFYRASGFRTVGRFLDYYEDPAEDAVLMALAPTARRRRQARRGARAGGPQHMSQSP